MNGAPGAFRLPLIMVAIEPLRTTGIQAVCGHSYSFLGHFRHAGEAADPESGV